MTPRPLNLSVSFEAVADAVAYILTVQKAGSQAVRTVAKAFTESAVNISSLDPATDYTIRLYITTDGVESFETEATTTANSVVNYDMADFSRYTGAGYDLSELGENSVKSLYGIINELFTTGEEVAVTLPGGSKKKNKFVNRGGSTSIVDAEALLLPFEEGVGASQSASLTLSDNSSVTVTSDEANDTIGVGGTVCSPGDSLVIDGKTMTVASI